MIATRSRELYRILKPDGAMSHRIDFKDHLGGSLNNMRFSTKIWESNFMSKSGFYTNRLKYSQMIAMLEEAGFRVDPLKIDLWSSLPLPKKSLAKEFQQINDNDLLVKGCDLLVFADPDAAVTNI